MDREDLLRRAQGIIGEDKTSLLEVERFTSPPDPELVCPICRCVFNNPHETRCRHVFCKSCIDTWFTTQNISVISSRSCPKCRKNMYHKARPSLPLISNLINKLSLHCCNQERGCDVVVTREKLDQHEATCDLGLVDCNNYCCKEKVMRKDKRKHAKVCAFRLEKCEGECELMIPRHLVKTHSCVAELKKRLKGWDTAIEISKRIRDRTIVKKTMGFQPPSKQESEMVNLLFECYTENLQRMAHFVGLIGLDQAKIEKMTLQLKRQELVLSGIAPGIGYSSYSDSSSSEDEFERTNNAGDGAAPAASETNGQANNPTGNAEVTASDNVTANDGQGGEIAAGDSAVTGGGRSDQANVDATGDSEERGDVNMDDVGTEEAARSPVVETPNQPTEERAESNDTVTGEVERECDLDIPPDSQEASASTTEPVMSETNQTESKENKENKDDNTDTEATDFSNNEGTMPSDASPENDPLLTKDPSENVGAADDTKDTRVSPDTPTPLDSAETQTLEFESDEAASSGSKRKNSDSDSPNSGNKKPRQDM